MGGGLLGFIFNLSLTVHTPGHIALEPKYAVHIFWLGVVDLRSASINRHSSLATTPYWDSCHLPLFIMAQTHLQFNVDLHDDD